MMLHVETLSHVQPGRRFWFLIHGAHPPAVALGIKDDWPAYQDTHIVIKDPDTLYRIHKDTPVVLHHFPFTPKVPPNVATWILFTALL